MNRQMSNLRRKQETEKTKTNGKFSNKSIPAKKKSVGMIKNIKDDRGKKQYLKEK